MNSQKMKIFFFFLIWRKWGEAWSERLRCSVREGSHSDKRYQINEGDDEAGRRRKDMIFLNCNHCCCQQSWHSSGWKILHRGGKRLIHERNTWREPSAQVETIIIVVTTKLKVSTNNETAAVPSWFWLCRCGLAGLVSWFAVYSILIL